MRTFVAQVYAIPSMSMQPLLDVGDRVVVSRLPHHVQRGDVVVFDGSESFAGDDAEGMVFVKRVIGLPGDRVSCCDQSGALTVNGERLAEVAYLYPGDSPSDVEFDIVVPEGRLWLMGDHRSQSVDSRDYLGAPGGGMVPVESVIGPVVARLWPVDRAGVLR